MGFQLRTRTEIAINILKALMDNISTKYLSVKIAYATYLHMVTHEQFNNVLLTIKF